MAYFEYQGLKDKEASLAAFKAEVGEYPAWIKTKQPPDSEVPLDKDALKKAVAVWRKQKAKDAEETVKSLDASYSFGKLEFPKGKAVEVSLVGQPKHVATKLKTLCAQGVLKEVPAPKKPAKPKKPKEE